MCRRSSGASFGTSALIEASAFTVVEGHGLVAVFESSPGYRRYFCSRCGSPLSGVSDRAPQLVLLRCGTLDSDPEVRPSAHIHVADRAPWIEIADDLERFAGPVGADDFRRVYFGNN